MFLLWLVRGGCPWACSWFPMALGFFRVLRLQGTWFAALKVIAHLRLRRIDFHWYCPPLQQLLQYCLTHWLVDSFDNEVFEHVFGIYGIVFNEVSSKLLHIVDHHHLWMFDCTDFKVDWHNVQVYRMWVQQLLDECRIHLEAPKILLGCSQLVTTPVLWWPTGLIHS